ncbi:MAG: hypothetical protein ACI9VR_001104 [Cognaticolwellia sp.]|jgi:hypothetical protein
MAALLLMVGLTWPLALHPAERVLEGPFAASLVVSFELVPQAIWSGQDPHLTSELGAPFIRKGRFLGWVLLLLALPLKFIGPVRFASLVTLASPALTVLAMLRLLRARAPDGSAAARGLASFTFAFAPFYMANLANGELAKAQAWMLPLCLLLAWRLRTDWRMLPLLAGLLLLTGLTSPYLLACVGLALAVDGLFSLKYWRRTLPVGVVLLVVLTLVSMAFDQDGKSHEWLFSPTHRPELSTPTELVAPYAVAPLSSLFWPDASMTPSGLQHGVYLCWSVLLTALLGMWQRRGVALGWTLAGVLGALGPVLFLTPSWYTGVALPMALIEPLGTGLSTSGMYYRLIQVALLGLALGIAHARLPSWSWVALGLVFAVEVTLAQGSSLPLPTQSLPHTRLAAHIAQDPLPGSVMDLPGWPRGETNRPHAMAFRLAHGKPVTALPRMPKHPAEYNLCLRLLDRCVDGQGGCQAPAWTLDRLEERGVRFVVLHTEQGHDIQNLERTLRGRLGEPVRWPDALLWTLVPDPAPSQEWSCGPSSSNLAPPPDVR